MKFIAEIDIMPLDNLLDPQGRAVLNTLHNLEYKTVEGVRVGKHIQLILEANDEVEARQIVDRICQQVLYNPVVHKYSFTIRPID